MLSAVTIVAHLALCILSNLYKNPHYYNGVWIIHFFVLGFALERLKLITKWANKIKYGYLIIVGLMLIGMIGINKTHQGARSRRYGANLNQQIQVAKELNRYGADVEVEFKTFHLDLFDLAIDVLRRMEPAKSEQVSKQADQPVKVDYIYPRHSFQKNGFSQLEVKK